MAKSHSVSPARLKSHCATGTTFALSVDAVPPESVLFFHGKITREQAEHSLISHNATEGLFLLRESVGGNYVISICHMNCVHHYNVERQPDGHYKIQTGRRFVGPVELVRHHSEHLDGFLTLARTPLNIPEGYSPLVLQGVSLDELEQKLRLKAVEMGLKGQSVIEALNGPMRAHLRHLVYKELHLCQPWYHHTIRRREAEHRLAEDGNYEGSFLVRFRREDATFVLSLCCQSAPKHYKIEERFGRLSIEGGQFFETLIEMIDHYHHRQDGLLCKLRRPVVAPNFTRSRSGSGTGTEVVDSRIPRQKEDTAVQTSFISSGDMSTWNGSHSLPSLCHSPPITTTVSISPQCTNGPRPIGTDLTHPKQDLISFADWPNVTKLLGEQADQKPLFAVSPETPVPNPASQITPTPNNAFLFQSESPLLLSNPVSCSATLSKPKLENSFEQSWSPGAKRLSLVDQSCLKPSELHCGDKAVVEVDALVRRALTSVSQPSENFDWQQFSRGSASAIRGLTTLDPVIFVNKSSAVTADSTNSICAPDNSFDNRGVTFCRTHPSAGLVSTAALPNETQTASLHLDPILDTPWEEPECSEDHSTPSSECGVLVAGDSASSSKNNSCSMINSHNTSTGTMTMLSASTAVVTNPFLPNFNQPHTQAASVLEAEAMISGATPIALTAFTPDTPKKTSPASVSLAHSPDVSTFCSAACCTQAGKGIQLTKPSDRIPSDWTQQPLCQRKMQSLYDELPLSHSLLSIDSVTLKERLGGGNFGYVVKGVYRTPSGQEVPVAVKTLKPNQITNAGEREILAEARTMAQLKHRHIVRLIGVCKEEKFMLVLELAPLGPINKYLKKRPDIPVHTLTELMHQVAMGMAYLESCKFVHRDLAARNVLLVTAHFAKISDFGMSKALNFGSDYYRAASAGKWPLKWYAPECIYYFRFDSKSDVWSYGITLWEVYSYGERPYRDMKGAQILAMLDQGLRLSRPSRCPESIYCLMQQCWNFEGVRRPTFAELVLALSRLLRVMPLPNLSPSITSVASSCETDTSIVLPPAPSVDSTDPTMYSHSKPANCSGSGGSGVNSGASDIPSF